MHDLDPYSPDPPQRDSFFEPDALDTRPSAWLKCARRALVARHAPGTTFTRAEIEDELDSYLQQVRRQVAHNLNLDVGRFDERVN